MHRYHVRHKHHHEPVYRVCPHCHDEFEAEHGAQKFCSHRCQWAAFLEKSAAQAKARAEEAGAESI